MRWLCIVVNALVVCEAVLVLHMSNKRLGEIDDPVKLISFCKNCNAPELEGSFVHGLIVKHGIREYSVTGEVVYCIPNFAEDTVMNKHQFANRIVFVNRGRVSIQEKINKIKATRAAAIIITDDGQCNEDLSYCGRRAGSSSEGGFIPHEDVTFWKSVRIPVLIVNQETANRLRGMMGNQLVEIPKLGQHNVTMIEDDGYEDEDYEEDFFDDEL